MVERERHRDARDRWAGRREARCCAEASAVRCALGAAVLAGAALILFAGAVSVGRQQKRALELEQGRRGGAGQQVTDGVWRGVSSVQTSVPQLCRRGPELVCSRYEAIVVLGGGPADKDGALPDWVKRRCDGGASRCGVATVPVHGAARKPR
jgi:hypothetical protein